MAIFGVVVSSLIIAGFWGINIGAIYPLVEVVFKGESLHGYVNSRILSSEQRIEIHYKRISELQAELDAGAGDRQAKIVSRLQVEHLGIEAMERSIAWLKWIEPTVAAYTPDGAYPTLLFLMGFLLLGTVIKLLALTANLMLVQVVTERTAIAVRLLFYRHALQLDLDDFGDTGSAQLTSRLTNDVGYLCGGINTLLGRLVREPLKLIVCFAGAALVCPRLLLLVMVVSPVVALVTHSLTRAIRRASRRVMSEMSQMYGMLSDSFAGIRLVKISNTQAVERAKFSAGLQTYYQRSMKMAFYSTLSRSSSEFLGTVFVCLGIVAGGYLVVNQKTHLMGIRMSLHPLEVGQILLFFGFLIGASDPARKLAEVWADLQRGIAAAQRVFEVIDRPVRVRNPDNAISPSRPHGMIRFSDVHFQYPSGPKVLSGVSLEIPHGQTIAVVGPNGCGKSTLISLLCRFDDPQQGAVLFDETSLKDMRVRDVRRRIGLVTQRTTLFDDSIANNIAYGCPRASRSDVVRAAKMAYADDFICN
ncbi:MAG TPA: ABC transporter ATP-binding protein, partial [Planctomycetaceae bacterium]|nr:ABC transporter ATP-binding protein [Planctomycetaceae bacterium]